MRQLRAERLTSGKSYTNQVFGGIALQPQVPLNLAIGARVRITVESIGTIEQVIGTHSFINRAQSNTDMARGYTLLLETLNGFAKAPVLPFEAKAIAIFDEFRSQKVRVATMDLRIAAIAISNNLVLLRAC